ncbi:MAG: YjfB family protein [Armatimonadetes bacterium]|nr:YjfB family protein [Armatimonadota bacterium]
MERAMRVEPGTASRIVAETVQPSSQLKEAVQVALLKRALENQKQEASELTRQLEPKGRVIDIVV